MDPGSSRILLGTAGVGGEDYWINTIGTDGAFANGVNVDSLGNVYAVGSSFDPVNIRNEAYILKFDKAGLLLWQREFNQASLFIKVALDSSANVYAVGTASSRHLIAKYNSSGVLQWQRQASSGNFESLFNIAIAPSGDIYAAGDLILSANSCLYIQKFNSSGTALGSRTLITSSNNSSRITGVALDASENVYISGRVVDSSNGSYGYTVKIPSSLVGFAYNAGFPRATSGSTYSTQVAVDSSGNSVTLGQTFIGGVSEYVVVKRNSSGTLLWKKNTTLGGNGNGANSSPQNAGGIALDSSGNIYVCGTRVTGGTASSDALVFKLDSAGSLVWSRTFGTGVQDAGYDIKVDNLGSIYICGFQSTSSQSKGFIAKLPDDGSLTGTYGAYTYASTSIGLIDTTTPDGSPLYSASSESRTPVTSALPDIAGSLAVSTIAL